MRKTIKRILASVLTVAMLLTAAPLPGFAGLDLPNLADLFTLKADATAYSGKCGSNLTWSLDTDTGVLTISGTGDMYYWDYLDDVPWYSNRSSVKTVVIGDSVTSIGNGAFYECTGFTSVTIGNSVTSIGSSAFYWCTGLTSVTIPDSVTSIGVYAFYNCTSLTSATIGNGVTSIGNGAFSYCTSLTSVTIPNSVTSIGKYAFRNCDSLTSITIGNSVTSIGNYAFENCKSLTSVTIPDSVTSISVSAFRDCTSLDIITVKEGNPNYSSDEYGVLFNKDKTLLIQYPIGNTRTSYTIPDSVTSIGEYAFRDCTSLTSVTIPDSVTSIGYGAFYWCTGLTSVTIPDSVTSIGSWAFDNCTNLTSVTIPDSVTSISEEAFWGCTSLTDVYYSGTEEEWNKISFGTFNEPLLKANIHYNSSGEYSNTKIEFTTDTEVVPIGSTFNISASFSSSTLTPSSQTVSYRIEGENDGIISNGSISVLGTKENAVISASFVAKKLGDYKIFFKSSDGAESSINICVASDTSDKYLASSLIKLRQNKIKDTKMLYGYLYDEGLTFGDGVKSFLRVKDFAKDRTYYYELVVMDILLNSSKDDDYSSVLEGNIESISKKLISYGLKYNKYTSQTAFENAKISNLSESEISGLKSSFEKADVICDGFSDASALINGFNTVKDYIDALSRYAALQNVKQGYIDVLRGMSAVIQHETGGTDLNAAYFTTALDKIANYYENYNVSVSDCFKKTAGDLIWDLTKEVIDEGIKYIIGAETYTIIKITKETVNLVWQVFEPTELIVGDATLKCTVYFENRLKNFLYSLSSQYSTNDTLENAICFNDCYALLLSSFRYGNSIHSSIEDISYNGTPGGAIGSLINSSNRVVHKQVCEHIEKSNEIVKNEYAFINNITENYKSYIYGSNMKWGITLDYNAELKTTNFPVLYDYSNVSMNLTQFVFDGEPIYLSALKPQRSGYEFSGWYYDKECSKSFVEGTRATDNLTLYAKWTPIAIYNVNDYQNSVAELLEINPQFGLVNKSKTLKASALATKNVYTVPAYIDGYAVARLSDNMVINNSIRITSVIIPNTVTYIGKNAFADCTNLQSVIIPESVTIISDGAFDGCNNIDSVIFNGTQEQWNKISIGKNNDAIINADIEYAEKETIKSVSVGDITLNYKKSSTITPIVDADEGAEYTVTYTSSDSSVAKVDENGNVYGAKKGSAEITVTVTDEFGNSVSDTCNVKVKYSFGQWLLVILLFGWIWY